MVACGRLGSFDAVAAGYIHGLRPEVSMAGNGAHNHAGVVKIRSVDTLANIDVNIISSSFRCLGAVGHKLPVATGRKSIGPHLQPAVLPKTPAVLASVDVVGPNQCYKVGPQPLK